MKAFLIMAVLFVSNQAFAGGGGGGCGKIPVLVKNKKLRCKGEINRAWRFKQRFDQTFIYDSDIPYDQGHAEVFDYIRLSGAYADAKLGITFHCDKYKDGKLQKVGDVYLKLDDDRVKVDHNDLPYIEKVYLNDGKFEAEISCVVLN